MDRSRLLCFIIFMYFAPIYYDMTSSSIFLYSSSPKKNIVLHYGVMSAFALLKSPYNFLRPLFLRFQDNITISYMPKEFQDFVNLHRIRIHHYFFIWLTSTNYIKLRDITHDHKAKPYQFFLELSQRVKKTWPLQLLWKKRGEISPPV